MEYYGQRDPRWRDEKLGTSNVTIGGFGCAVTSAAMLCEYVGVKVNPSQLNTWLIENNGFSKGNLLDWKVLNKFTNNKLTFAGMKSTWQDKWPQIAEVDLVPHDSDFDQHFVLQISSAWCFDPWENRVRKIEDFGKVKSYRIYNYEELPMSDKDDRWYRNNYWTYFYNQGLALIAPIVNVVKRDDIADNEEAMKELARKTVDAVSTLDQRYKISSDRAATAETLHQGAIEREKKLVEDNKKLNNAVDSLEVELLKTTQTLSQERDNALTRAAIAEARVIELESQQGIPWQNFASRKFLLVLLATVVNLGNYFFNWGLDLNELLTLLAPILGYLGVEGVRDIVAARKPDVRI
jgi:hypothetical protein